MFSLTQTSKQAAPYEYLKVVNVEIEEVEVKNEIKSFCQTNNSEKYSASYIVYYIPTVTVNVLTRKPVLSGHFKGDSNSLTKKFIFQP